MRRLKWIALILVLSLLIIIVFQNLAATDVHLLFWTVVLPQAALLTVTLGIGFGLGLAARPLWKVRAWRARSASAKKTAEHAATAAQAE